MDKNKKKKMVGIGIGVIAAIGLLAFATLLAFAAPDVASSINYQGRLTDSAGNPRSGIYLMTFKLYETSTGGTALISRANHVEITNGLFNTNIDFGTTYFDGRALWLGITVGSDSEMTPRQQLRPVPYALSLRPGARIIGSANTALHAESTNPSGRGIRGYATATSGTNYGVVGASKSPDGYGGCFYNNEGGIGVYGEGKYGGHFTTNQGGTFSHFLFHPNAAVNATTTHGYSDGVHAKTTGHGSAGVRAYTTGGNSPGFYASTAGDDSWGVRIDTSGDESHGVNVRTDGSDSAGVWAYSVNHYGVYGEGKYGGYFTTNQNGLQSNPNAGVYVLTTHWLSEGVQAHTTGSDSAGVSAHTTGRRSPGVSADTTGYSSLGVRADTTGDRSTGVSGRTTGDHSAGVSADTTGDRSPGVWADTTGDRSPGVSADTTGDHSAGVSAGTTGYSSPGVSADTTGDYSVGVGGHTTGDHSVGVGAFTEGDYSKGVRATANGDGSHGVWAYSSKAEAIYAITGRADHKYGVYTPDKICAMSYDTTSSDVAEYFAVDEDVEAGTVMVIGGNGKLRCSTEAYDTTVAGIVSTSPGMSLGINEEGNEGEKLIAVAGRVPCKVDASYAPIKSGDLLTTSDTPGYAMKATNPQIGTILGKALEPMDSGTGVIEVLITLQ